MFFLILSLASSLRGEVLLSGLKLSCAEWMTVRPLVELGKTVVFDLVPDRFASVPDKRAFTFLAEGGPGVSGALSWQCFRVPDAGRSTLCGSLNRERACITDWYAGYCPFWFELLSHSVLAREGIWAWSLPVRLVEK